MNSSNNHAYRVYNLRTSTIIELINVIIDDSKVAKLVESDDNEILEVWETPKNATNNVEVPSNTPVDSYRTTKEEKKGEQ